MRLTWVARFGGVDVEAPRACGHCGAAPTREALRDMVGGIRPLECRFCKRPIRLIRAMHLGHRVARGRRGRAGGSSWSAGRVECEPYVAIQVMGAFGNGPVFHAHARCAQRRFGPIDRLKPLSVLDWEYL